MKKENIELLKRNFEDYVECFYENPPRNWEEKLELHKKVIERLRSFEPKKRGELFVNDDFLQQVYNVVKKWVEVRAAKMVEIDDFRDGIKKNLPAKVLSDLAEYALSGLDEKKWREIKNKIEKGFFVPEKPAWKWFKLKVMNQYSQLVGFSKTLHHLLPDLIPPIDREHIVRFCYGRTTFPFPDEPKIFFGILDVFYSICNDLGLTEKNCKRRWDTSVPKLIDNAIIGFVRNQKAKKKQTSGDLFSH